MIDYGFKTKTNVPILLDTLKLVRAEYYRAWRNDARVRKWCRQYDLIGEKDQLDWMEHVRLDPKISMFEIIKGDDTPVGVCGLTDIDLINRRAEFSLYIAPKFHRLGYSKPALKTLLSFGFRALGLNRIWGECFEGNGANNIFESMGFIREGVRRDFYYRDGEFIDCNLLSIDRDCFDKHCDTD